MMLSAELLCVLAHFVQVLPHPSIRCRVPMNFRHSEDVIIAYVTICTQQASVSVSSQ